MSRWYDLAATLVEGEAERGVLALALEEAFSDGRQMGRLENTTALNRALWYLYHELAALVGAVVMRAVRDSDEDRFGSTNDLDSLRACLDAYHDYQHQFSDYGPDADAPDYET